MENVHCRKCGVDMGNVPYDMCPECEKAFMASNCCERCEEPGPEDGSVLYYGVLCKKCGDEIGLKPMWQW